MTNAVERLENKLASWEDNSVVNDTLEDFTVDDWLEIGDYYTNTSGAMVNPVYCYDDLLENGGVSLESSWVDLKKSIKENIPGQISSSGFVARAGNTQKMFSLQLYYDGERFYSHIGSVNVPENLLDELDVLEFKHLWELSMEYQLPNIEIEEDDLKRLLDHHTELLKPMLLNDYSEYTEISGSIVDTLLEQEVGKFSIYSPLTNKREELEFELVGGSTIFVGWDVLDSI